MKKLAILILLALSVSSFGQRITRPVDWKKVSINIGMSMISVALEMTGDALYDMGKIDGNIQQMRLGHGLQAAGYVAPLAMIPLLKPEMRDVPVILSTYLGVRFFMADGVYNKVRGNGLLDQGTVTWYDRTMSQIPPDGRAWYKGWTFALVFGININYW